MEEYNQKTGDTIRMADLSDPAEYGALNVAFEGLFCWYPWIFKKYTRKEVLSYLEFSEEVKRSGLYRYYESIQGTYDVAHVRRDDLTYRNDTNGYSVISLDSYRKAFQKFDCDPDQLVYVSDDPRVRTSRCDYQGTLRDSAWRYPTGESPINGVFYTFFQDFLKMIFARKLFRANSSFSWWAGFLRSGPVYAPLLRERADFPRTGREIQAEFVEGNEPHWFCLADEPCARIEIP